MNAARRKAKYECPWCHHPVPKRNSSCSELCAGALKDSDRIRKEIEGKGKKKKRTRSFKIEIGNCALCGLPISDVNHDRVLDKRNHEFEVSPKSPAVLTENG